MATGVVIIHLGRCGSTVLGNLLNQHSQITWRGEILEPIFQAARKQLGDHYVLNGDPVRLALQAVDNCPTEYCGVEFKPYHLAVYQTPLASFVADMREAGFRHFVVLDRRNRLRKIVSSRLAATTGVWHVPPTAVRDGQVIDIDVDHFSLDRKAGTLAEVLKMYDAEFEELRRLLSPGYLDLIYEDHIEGDPTIAYQEVVNYLGLTADPVEIKLGRTTAAPLREVVANFESVARHLTGTRYAWMLEG